MKLTIVLLMFVFLHAGAAEVHSQGARVTIDADQATLAEVLDEMERQTEYLFFYNKKNVNANKCVKVKVKDTPVSEVLDKTLDDDVAYIMVNDHIILSKKKDDGINAIFQQVQRITGTVKDIYGEALSGANVMEKGTTNGTMTDMDGNFSLITANNAVLQISYIGYITQEISVLSENKGRENKPILITLLEDNQMLDEVVVVGYGTQKKVNLT
ncbi:MAG: carboxypeptidase-like regulatory domain-containing protein, partial [Tannerella sp.]|nr:carboxypeptidase-like regulatory domain-containing protein [Tannerella sp.]